ncbi:chromosome partition protein Smc [Paenibacillus sp. J31TS4]|uniref:chromosome segregation protein SMC n=1 Tax=Paenibacillus sp. J31TS4 TaxID=2807195 RepID=UPI001B2450B7|nr:chromosome segregation protein SMC [Paenibacillus sp. J31TS4]GIP36769.1 chromosome partition protein Smc [Paenibacillus sp. J31TS4]
MFLKRIELAGFKSFADKTELEFVQGITAVVGPNGSGKSNISDGIRWVLGEQSARSLRGGKMEDVIFAGSDARKAVNYGEVSLTLDNSDNALGLDFSEVTVTRRVHRSGDSEYFINRQSCRLKDITELFMDTGIGKEAYSIIGQGRIEEILSTKSEDRRGIFEEASGIVKYKSRKKEAEKKLNETEQNLLRIHDLVSELEDQIEPLRLQSEKAIRYKQLKEVLKKSEISLYVYQIEEIHRNWSAMKQRLEELKTEQMELASVVNQHDAYLERHRWETRRLEQELQQLQESLLTISAEFEKCEGQGEVLRERKKHLASTRAQLEQTIGSQEERIGTRRDDLAETKQKIVTVSQQLEDCRDQLTEEEEKLLGVNGGISSEAEETHKAELLDALNAIAQSRNELRYAEQQLEAVARREGRLEGELAKWAEEKDKLASRRTELEASKERVGGELTHIRERYAELVQSLKAKSASLEQSQLAVRREEQRRDALLSRKDTMKEMQDDYDGFQHGVKEVLKAAKRPDGLRGIHGAVAELVTVPAEIELAVETALGGALQNIVVENEADGRTAIAFLKKRQSGRATFLPLDVIRGRSVSDHDLRAVEGQPGFVGVAAELVRFDDKYRNIFSSLLGTVIIAETLEDANRIAAKCQYRFRVVTREGDVVNPGGSMTGGSQHRKTTSLLGRQRQIEELTREIAQADKQLAALQEQTRQLRQQLAAENEELERLREEGERKRIEEQQYAAELAPLAKEAQKNEELSALYEQDQEALEDEKRQLLARRTEAEAQLAAMERREKELQQAIRDAELARKASESAKEELVGQMTELKVQAASLAQEKQSLVEQYKRLQADHGQAESELEMNRRLLEQVIADSETNEKESLMQAEQLNDLKSKKQSCLEKTEYKRAERAEWAKTLEEEENKTRTQRNQLKKVEEELHQTEVRLNRSDVELDNLLNKLAEDYELSYEMAKDKYPLPEDVTATQATVKELKRQITALGDVNLGAIEEYSRVNERYEFLSEQKADLTEAKTTLYHVIREMDEEMSRRFRTTFEAIRSHFVIVFAKLFGGGRADLILSDPSSPLDTGIEIVAQPPGKKLQNLQLLSGGERALTAIALLFSILRVKPVPFCVLDEVEAALDEANVSRFAEYLREFSHVTQFIVVTHRKGTMEEADVLYGVTMEEGGVSKLVSVKLEQEEAAVSA